MLAILASDGRCSLESLAKKTSWPKSSILRYLQALEAYGAVSRSEDSKLWQARQKLCPIVPDASEVLERARTRIPKLANEVNCCVELYRLERNTLVLSDRAEPENELVSLRARIGFERNLQELDATSLIFFAFQETAMPSSGLWAWHEGRQKKVGARTAQQRIAVVRESGWALDNDFNEYGYRRFACPVLDGDALVGVLAIAQRLTPLAEREKPHLIKTLKSNLIQ